MSGEVRYPEIEVELLGHDTNAFAILGTVSRALKRGGVEKSEVEKYMAEAMGGSYDELLATTMRWVEVS